MHDVAVALDGAEGPDLHRARRRHAAEVVARKVHQHHVLRILLWVGEEFGLERGVLGCVRAARASAGDWSHLGVAAVQLDECLGRGADHHAVAELAVIHVGRGIQKPQRAIGLERIEVAAAREAHRQHELVDVARGDVLLGACHACEERFLGQAGLRRAELRSPGRPRQPAAQRADDLAAQALAFLLRSRVQQRRAAREVVEHQQRARGDVVRVGAVVVGARERWQALEIPHEVIARNADQPTQKREALARQVRMRRGRERPAEHGEEFRLVRRARQPVRAYAQARAVEAELQAVTEADERVTGEALAALHAFQQEARMERLQLQVRRHRGVEVGGDVEHCGRHLRFLCREDPGTHKKTHPRLARGDGSWIPANEVRVRAHS